VADIQNGATLSAKEFRQEPNGIRILRGINIKPGSIDWTETAYWSTGGSDIQPKFHLQVNDVLLPLDRPVMRSGPLRVGLIQSADLPSVHISRTARLRAISEQLTPAFLFLVATSRHFKSFLLAKQKGEPIPHVSTSDLATYEFHLPSLEQQQRIADLAAYFDAHIQNLEMELGQPLSDGESASLTAVRRAVVEDLLDGTREIPAEYDLLMDSRTP